MVGWKRWSYNLFGWEYDPEADEKQKRLKYLSCEQIKKSNIKLKSSSKSKAKKKKKKKIIKSNNINEINNKNFVGTNATSGAN